MNYVRAMACRRIAFWAILLLLAGCSYQYDLVAVERGGAIVFQPAKKHGNGCLSDMTIESENGEIMWRLDAGKYRAADPDCPSSFPVTYGVAPHGLPQQAPAKALKPGVLYFVQAWDGDSYTGAFRFKQGIIVENDPTRWRDLSEGRANSSNGR
jgi:hypothetical protein